MKSPSLTLILTLISLGVVHGNHYDVRCKCVCPNLGIINASSISESDTRRIYIKTVEPRWGVDDDILDIHWSHSSHCNCHNVVIPSLNVEDAVTDSRLPESLCPRCVCRYEQRNTLIIKVVVILIIFIITFLTLYMGYLLFIDPIFVKWKQSSYRQQREEEVNWRALCCLVCLCSSDADDWLFVWIISDDVAGSGESQPGEWRHRHLVQLGEHHGDDCSGQVARQISSAPEDW